MIRTKEEVAELRALVEAQAKMIDLLERERKQLKEQVDYLLNKRFGRSSERLTAGQLGLFGGQAHEPEPVENEIVVRKKRKQSSGHGREPFPQHLPRNVIQLDLDEQQRTCHCGAAMHSIGIEVTERGRLITARFEIDRFERPKYACPHGHAIKTAPLPDGVIDGGKYDASVYAHVAVAKYQDHLPLNRLQGIFSRHGVKLSKQTMWDMLVVVDALVAQPVLRQMHLELLQEDILHADETPVRLCVEGKKGGTNAYVFGYRSLAAVDEPKALVDFRTSRGGTGPKTFLRGWAGTLIIDGYSGYSDVCRTNGIRRAGCWAHVRRKFKDAWDAGAKKAGPMMRDIGRLFAVERAIKHRVERLHLQQPEALALRAKVRARTSSKLIERIHKLGKALDQDASVLPKSNLGKAVSYLDNQRPLLRVFLDEPRLPIHNNDQERDLRHIVTGRKNWMIFASPRGGEVGCRLYSLMLSCRQNGVNPEAYMTDVLMAVATTPASEIASLTPWAWARRQRGEQAVS